MNSDMRVQPIIALFLCYGFAFSQPVQSASAVAVTEAWMRTAPPGVTVYAGYLLIRNQGDQAIRLIGASSPRFERVEIHESQLENNMARMRKLTGVDIPAQASVRFQPGAYHLMLFHPHRPPGPGESIALVLQFFDGQQVSTHIQVKEGL